MHFNSQWDRYKEILTAKRKREGERERVRDGVREREREKEREKEIGRVREIRGERESEKVHYS